MKGALRIGSYAGIAVFLHWTLFAMLGGIFVFFLYKGATIGAALLSLVLIGLIFGSVILHEYGHALMARRFGVPTLDITMYPIGGVARLARMPRNPKQELLIALAGPAVNLVLAVLLVIAGADIGSVFGVTVLSKAAILNVLLVSNLVMAGFNMLPAFPMDGGRVLRAALASKMSYERATQIAGIVGMGMGVLFGIIGVVSTNFVLAFIGMFVFVGARHEIRQVVGTI